MNEAVIMTRMNSQIARAYLSTGDPEIVKRSWQTVVDEMMKIKAKANAPATVNRWKSVIKDEALVPLLKKPLLETHAEDLLKALETCTVSTNVFRRRIHNFAVGVGWLPWPIVPKKLWPQFKFQPKRAITEKEHHRIIERENNPERKAFYELCWHTGAAQGDVALLLAEDIDWSNRTMCFHRRKTGQLARITFGPELEKILRELPKKGPLFPKLSQVEAKDRATEFRQRCQGLGIAGVTLHSYRYAWAQRAKQLGYPERYAQIFLGHSSKAVHRAYARGGDDHIPSLDEFKQQRDHKSQVPLPRPDVSASSSNGSRY